MTELASEPLQTLPTDTDPIMEQEERPTARDILKIVGFVVLGVLLSLIAYGVFRYLLVQSYGGY